MPFHIVLIEPEIPQNTGNIARTCAATGSVLHLVGKMGFSIDEKHVKRAGLDYWHLVNIQRHDTFEELQIKYPNAVFYFATTKAPQMYSEICYKQDAFIVFGKETKGLPEELLKKNIQTCLRIPMLDKARSLNLANSVAVVLYEALRQHEFDGLIACGKFTT